MKKEQGIILAGSLGVLIGITLIGVRKFILRKKKEYDDYYSDYHRLF